MNITKSNSKTRSAKITAQKKMPDFKIQESQLRQLILEELERDPALLSALERLINKLDNLDTSVDYLAALMSGVPPAEIELSQTAFGRLHSPTHGRVE